MATKYLRQIDTGRIYVHTDLIAERADMEPYEMPVEKIILAAVKSATEPAVKVAAADSASLPEDTGKAAMTEGMTAEQRVEKIAAAVAAIPIVNYGKPHAGKPAMPKVADVSKAAGFTVAADEVSRAMGVK